SLPSHLAIMSTVGDHSGRASSGVIRWEVDAISTLDSEGAESHTIEALGVEWDLHLEKASTEGVDHLAAFLRCAENRSNFWSVDVAFEMELFGKDEKSNEIYKFSKRFDCKTLNWGGCNIKWAKLFDKSNNFVKDDKITVEARITFTNIRGLRIVPTIDFTDDSDPRNDGILVIEGKKLHVSKQLLSLHSPYFNTMFYGNFDEKEKKEIEIEDVQYQEFVELLNVIY
ncbi:hypothetical protein PFISCL1PPCAC_29143, partial [Pristionchus fissidentatus]